MDITFRDSEADLDFNVEPRKRTIAGVIVPWNHVAMSGGARWQFKPNSLDWGKASKVKLNLNHDHDQLPIGVAANFNERPDGLYAQFKVSSDAAGDRALALAQDGILDGFSIEVRFAEDSYQPDANDRGLNVVRHAQLRGVALTHEPAFEAAVVEAIAASEKSNREGAKMATETKQEEEKPDQLAEFSEKTITILERLVEAQEKQAENMPQAVAKGIAAVQADFVKDREGYHIPSPFLRQTYDPPVYQFGRLGITGASIVRDAYYAVLNNDDEARGRLQRYRGQMSAIREGLQAEAPGAQFTQVTTSNAAQVVPPGYRPELYVPQLFQGRPATDAVSRGVIENASPFTVPTFSSATGASGTHTEGTNPTDGSLNFGTKTVSPTAQSGILNLSREIIDSANPAIDAIAFAAMREEYARDTEAITIAMLENATLGLGGTIGAGTGLVPSGAQALNVTLTTLLMQPLVLGSDTGGIRAAMARYPFLRFASPTRALLSQAATSALATASAGASDATPLLPSIGATQSVGTGNAATQGWIIDGLAFIPAWSLPGTTSDVILLNEADVWAWESPLLTFRYEEKLGPATIQLALFGYFGVHVLRPVGLSGLRGT